VSPGRGTVVICPTFGVCFPNTPIPPLPPQFPPGPSTNSEYLAPHFLARPVDCFPQTPPCPPIFFLVRRRLSRSSAICVIFLVGLGAPVMRIFEGHCPGWCVSGVSVLGVLFHLPLPASALVAWCVVQRLRIVQTISFFSLLG